MAHQAYRTEILHLAASLDYLQTGRFLCPACGGGSSHEKSLAVTRSSTGVHFKCHRSTCQGQLSGFISTGVQDLSKSLIGRLRSDPVGVPGVPPKNVPRPFTEALAALDGDDLEFFDQAYDIPYGDIEEAGISWCGKQQRYVFPIMGPNGETLGDLARTYNPKDLPKILRYQTNFDKEFMSWHIVNRSVGYAFLVEDFISALKIYSLGHNAVALLGTHITPDKISEIRKVFPNVILWLDMDAYLKALDYKKEFGLFFNRFEVYCTESDPKDIPREVLRGYLRNAKDELLSESGVHPTA